jgi:hypothetical protein
LYPVFLSKCNPFAKARRQQFSRAQSEIDLPRRVELHYHEGGKTMRIVDMRVQCSDRFSEVLASAGEYIELTIESVVGTALLEVFDTIHVENISVHPGPGSCDDDGDGG